MSDKHELDLLLAMRVHAAERADELDRQATKLEEEAMRKRIEAFQYRAHARVAEVTA